MPLTFHLVDAFTAEPFRGNPAVVYVLDGWRDAVWHQRISREMNQSETAFVVPTGGEFALRWFTPTVEVDLCGHATLAAAHVLWTAGHCDNPLIRFQTRSGLLTASRRGERIELDFPRLAESPVAPPAGLIESMGCETPVYIGQSRHDLVVQLTTAAQVRSLRPNFTRLAEVATRGVIVTAKSDDPRCDFVSRFFAPAAGIAEDPVTGSAHCCLADFWQQRLGKAEMIGFQASARGGFVQVRDLGDRVMLGGQAVTVARGELLAE